LIQTRRALITQGPYLRRHRLHNSHRFSLFRPVHLRWPRVAPAPDRAVPHRPWRRTRRDTSQTIKQRAVPVVRRVRHAGWNNRLSQYFRNHHPHNNDIDHSASGRSFPRACRLLPGHGAACALPVQACSKGNDMNRTLLQVALIAVLSAPAAGFLLAACSSTATQRSVGEYTDDASISTRVKLALANTPGVKATEVQVETYRGVVQLSGFTDSADMARAAVDAARRVAGVREVKNDIRLRSGS